MTDTTTRTFSLAAILSMTDGHLVGTVDEMFALQDHIVGRSLMTHERTTNVPAQVGALLRLFPRLAEAEFPPIPAGVDPETHCKAWVSAVAEHVGWSEAKVPGPLPGCQVDPGAALDKVLDLMAGRKP